MKNNNFKYQRAKRLFDILFACLGLILLSIPFFVLGVILKLTSNGPIIHWSKRTGINNSCFRMAKLRTMKIETPEISEKLLANSYSYCNRIGKFLRKYGIDELPQLYNILIGDMSFVGPRPILFNDEDLIFERNKRGINNIKPGLTGLAQINGRSEISASKKAEYDEYYMKNISLILDLKIICKTNLYLLQGNHNGSHLNKKVKAIV